MEDARNSTALVVVMGRMGRNPEEVRESLDDTVCGDDATHNRKPWSSMGDDESGAAAF